MDEVANNRVRTLSAVLDWPTLDEDILLIEKDPGAGARRVLLSLFRSTEHARFDEALGCIIELVDSTAPARLRALLTSFLYNLLKGPFSFPAQRQALFEHLPSAFRPSDEPEARYERLIGSAAPTLLRLLASAAEGGHDSVALPLIELLSVLTLEREQVCAGLRKLAGPTARRGAVLIALARHGDPTVVEASAGIEGSSDRTEVLYAACAHAIVGTASSLVTSVVSTARDFSLGEPAPFVGRSAGELLLRSLTRVSSRLEPLAVLDAFSAAMAALPEPRGSDHVGLYKAMFALAGFRPIPFEEVMGRERSAPLVLTAAQRHLVELIARDPVWDSRSLVVRAELQSFLGPYGLGSTRESLLDLAASRIS